MDRVGQDGIYIDVYTVHDRIFGDFPAKKTIYTPYNCMVLTNPTHESHVYDVGTIVMTGGKSKNRKKEKGLRCVTLT
jgi:hypothetical protein